jgi:hypothetical protein
MMRGRGQTVTLLNGVVIRARKLTLLRVNTPLCPKFREYTFLINQTVALFM